MQLDTQDEIDRELFHMILECARPSWRFRAMFCKSERDLLQAAINTLMGARQSNKIMSEMDRRRYGVGLPNAAPAGQIQQGEAAMGKAARSHCVNRFAYEGMKRHARLHD